MSFQRISVVRTEWFQSLSQWILSLFRDIFAIILIGLGLSLLLCCLTYSHNDPSLLQATNHPISNIFGLWGATYADFMLQSLGYTTYLLPVILTCWGYHLFYKKHGLSKILSRSFYLLPVLVLCAASFNIFFDYFTGPAGSNGVGGAIGQYSAVSLQYIPNKLGFIGRFLFNLALGYITFHSFIHLCGYSFSLRRQISLLTFFSKSNAAIVAQPKGKKTKKPHLTSQEKRDTLEEKVKNSSDYKDYQGSSLGNFAKNNLAKIKKVKPKKLPPQVEYDGEYNLPEIDLLQATPRKKNDPLLSEEILKHNAQLLEGVLEDFGVKGVINQWYAGPVVTLYELEPAAGIRSSRVIGLADDIARAMSAISARVAVIPGKNAIGIELPNTKREMVYLKEILDHKEYKAPNKELPLGLGKDIGGNIVATDLAKMPHLLIAGTTGSGKSVGINTMILSLLYRLSPDECKMIMIDPKMLELSIYNGIPHLLTPVVTNPKKAVYALKWVVREMEERYDLMSKVGVRKLSAFNDRIAEAEKTGEVLTRKRARGFDPATGYPVEEEEVIPLKPIPYIVVVVDEMADLMLVAGKEIEGLIQRLAQMARAAGIHIITATQRPSVDVITGTIKANFPTRISFQVTSKIDSRTILGEMGAEQLLGQGDMLFMESGGRIRRVHGAFVSDGEVEDIVNALKNQGTPEYIEDITDDPEESNDSNSNDAGDNQDLDPMFKEAVEVIKRDQKVSTSYIQRKLKIGYNRAARIIDEMQEQGIVTEADHTGKRALIA